MFTSLGLVWQAVLKKTKVKLDLLIGTDMLLMVEKGIRGGICHVIYQYAKTNNKHMKNYDKNKDLKHWDVKIYMDGQFHKGCL